MFVIYVKSSLYIKTYTDHEHACPACGALDLQVKVSADYYHLFFVPLAPGGSRSTEVLCNQCAAPMRLYNLEQQYERKAKSPFYLYTIPILITAIIAFFVCFNLRTQSKKAEFVADPKVGDVYTMSEGTKYYFLKLVAIDGAMLTMQRNSMDYDDYPSGRDRMDYFVEQSPVFYTKAQLQERLDNEEIADVSR